MLEGLEISVISKSNLEFTGRLDSEYYKKSYLLFEKQILRHNSKKLEEIAKFLIGPFGSAFDTENYIEKGPYRYVRGQDVKPFILRDDDNKFISYDDFERLKKYALKENDLLVSVVGTLGNVCMVQTKDLPAIFSCKSTVIRSIENSSYVLTYLNCKYGHELLLRKERGAIQKGLNLDDLKTLLIPLFSENFQKIIENFFFSAQDKIEKSKQLYGDAENLLLKELDLNDWKPTKNTITTKTLNDYKISGRLDAEYYQPKYDEIENKIRSYKEYDKISKHFHQQNKICDFSQLDYNYIEIGDINIGDGSINYNKVETKNLPANAKYLVEDGHILISKVRPYRGAVAINNLKKNDLIASSAFTILGESGKLRKEVLMVLLRTSIYKQWLLKWNVGSSYPVIKDENVLNLIVPILPDSVQESIVSKVQQSFTLKTKSEKLLELAKTAVEIAIEQGEEQAIKLIDTHA